MRVVKPSDHGIERDRPWVDFAKGVATVEGESWVFRTEGGRSIALRKGDVYAQKEDNARRELGAYAWLCTGVSARGAEMVRFRAEAFLPDLTRVWRDELPDWLADREPTDFLPSGCGRLHVVPAVEVAAHMHCDPVLFEPGDSVPVKPAPRRRGAPKPGVPVVLRHHWSDFAANWDDPAEEDVLVRLTDRGYYYPHHRWEDHFVPLPSGTRNIHHFKTFAGVGVVFYLGARTMVQIWTTTAREAMVHVQDRSEWPPIWTRDSRWRDRLEKGERVVVRAGVPVRMEFECDSWDAGRPSVGAAFSLGAQWGWRNRIYFSLALDMLAPRETRAQELIKKEIESVVAYRAKARYFQDQTMWDNDPYPNQVGIAVPALDPYPDPRLGTPDPELEFTDLKWYLIPSDRRFHEDI